MIERVCSRTYVYSTKGTSHFGIVRNRSRLSVFEPSAIAVTTTSGDHPGWTFQRKGPTGILSPSAVTEPRESVNEESSDVRPHRPKAPLSQEKYTKV